MELHRTSEWLSVVICTVFTEPKRNPRERKANRVKKMIPVHKESAQIKERNSCVYFAEVRNEPNRSVPVFCLWADRHPKDYQLLHLKVQSVSINPWM